MPMHVSRVLIYVENSNVYLYTPLCLYVSLLVRPFEFKEPEERSSECLCIHMYCLCITNLASCYVMEHTKMKHRVGHG